MSKTDPKLTIDFKGLCAFVADHEDPKQATRLHVAMMGDKEQNGVCRHDPLVLFRLEDFAAGDSATVHYSSHTVDGQHLGFWPVHGKTLTLDGIKLPQAPKVSLRRTYGEVLRIADLNGGKDGAVVQQHVTKPGKHGVGAVLEIRHGVVSAHTWTDERWAIAPSKATPKPDGYFYVRQVVRWRIVAPSSSVGAGVTLKAGPHEWIQFTRGAHIVISNLCPFKPEDVKEAEDVLAYYPICKNPLPPPSQNVLHLEGPSSLAAKTLTRPGMDACPPAAAYLG